MTDDRQDLLELACHECDHTLNMHPGGGECIAADCECIEFEVP